MIGESIKDALKPYVFEPNSLETWNSVQGLLSNYLFNLWKQGALQGSKPGEAFFVKVGLGTTMTAQDILEGRMVIEAGVALMRPAEFIILQFTQMMQSS